METNPYKRERQEQSRLPYRRTTSQSPTGDSSPFKGEPSKYKRTSNFQTFEVHIFCNIKLVLFVAANCLFHRSKRYNRLIIRCIVINYAGDKGGQIA